MAGRGTVDMSTFSVNFLYKLCIKFIGRIVGLTGNNFKVLRILNFVQKKQIWVAADRFEVKYVMSVVSILLSADSAGVDDASDSVNKVQ